jgi:endonuclease/exonuclease/phosphatase family metal-dependent hydrolase
VSRSLVPAAGALLLIARPAAAAQTPITIDGAFDDWSAVAVAYGDAAEGGPGVDFGRLWIANDDRFLFLRLEMGQEIDLSENNGLRVYLDTDEDAGTGTPVAGIGAELEWRLGERLGLFTAGGDTTVVFHDDIRFRALPTVTATEFEMALGRDTLPDGQSPLFLGPAVRIVVRDDVGGDQLPEPGELVTYALDPDPLPPEPPIALARQDPGDLRVITFNVLSDGPWQPSEEPRFERLVAAADPDVICFQEIYDHSPAQAAALVGSWLPADTWSGVGTTDCKTVTRLPILDTWPVGNEVAALIDAGTAIGADLLVINAHLPCCADDSGRQAAADEIMAFVRDARSPGGQIDLDPQTPIVIAGDLNLVGFARQLETLLTGDIADEGTYGPDFTPDWDGSDLADVIARQTEKRMAYTWRSDTSSFWPGRLDFIIATDSVVEIDNRFILYTPEMSPGELAASGLLAGDSLASDHLLLAADLRGAGPPCPADLDGSGAVDVLDFLTLLAAWGPNPGHPADLDENGVVNVADFLLLLSEWGPC